MSLKPEKIDHLAHLVYQQLDSLDEVTLNEDKASIIKLIKQVIQQDFKEEAAIEEEARRLLDEHKQTIEFRGVSYQSLLQKTKQKIANERRFVL